MEFLSKSGLDNDEDTHSESSEYSNESTALTPNSKAKAFQTAIPNKGNTHYSEVVYFFDAKLKNV